MGFPHQVSFDGCWCTVAHETRFQRFEGWLGVRLLPEVFNEAYLS